MVLLAGQVAQAAILVRNDNQRWVRFTVYDLTRNELDKGCVAPKGNRRWFSASYEAMGGLFFLRGELMEGANCAGKPMFDTQYGPALTINANTTRERTLAAGTTPSFTDGEQAARPPANTRQRRGRR